MPEISVPVITVPKPFILKTRSIGSRNRASELFPGTSTGRRASSRFSSSTPAPVSELTGTIGVRDGSRKEPRRKSSTSSLTTARVSLSTVSDFVRTTIPRWILNRRQMSKCSRVCGLIDSSAAITNRTRSMPPTPASILRTKRS